MIITTKSGTVITIDSAEAPEIAVSPRRTEYDGQYGLMASARRIKRYCETTQCSDCVFESQNDSYQCRLSPGFPDSWEV